MNSKNLTRHTHKVMLLGIASAILLQIPNPSMAQQGGVLEEVLVTAQKREQLASDVGIAITTFSGDQLNALGIENSTELIAYTPGVSMAGDIGGQRAIFNIRGVVQNDYADIAEAPVAVYIDGTYLASTQAQTFGLFDIARVEVLKGPQGTLFGRNATGGLVNTITAKPSEERDGYISATVASFSQFRLEGAVGGSLSDSVRGRMSALSNQQGEILTNIYNGTDANGDPGAVGGGGDGYNDDTLALRGQLEFDLSENSTLLLSANYADATKSEGPYQVVSTTEIRRANGEAIDVIRSVNDPLNCDIIQAGACIDGNGDGSATRPVVGGDFFGNPGDPDGTGNLVNKDFAYDDQNQIESIGFMAQFDVDTSWGDFVSVTDYKNFTRVIGLDSDQSPTDGLIFQSDGDIDQFSQEFRFSGSTEKVKWIAGLYYLDIATDYIQGLAETAGAPSNFGLAGAEANTIVTLDTQSTSIFGQFDVAMSDQITLTAGLRIIREEKQFEGIVNIYANTDDRLVETDILFAEGLDQLTADNDATLWSGKLQLDYKPDDDHLYYVGISRGVKAGSFNAPLFGGFTPYDEEELMAFEAGAKMKVAGGAAQINASVFLYDYSDYQSFTFANNSSSVTNEDANYTGAEIEIFASPADGWELMFGASYIDAVVEDLQIASDIFRDTEPPFTPEWQFSGMLRYSWEGFGGNLAAQLNASYQSEFFFNPKNFTAHKFDSYTVADARLSWSDTQGQWSAVVFVDNFTDDDHSVIGFDVSSFYGTSQESYAKPRTWGVSVRRDF